MRRRGKWGGINAHARRTPGSMNKTEEAFASEVLDLRQRAGEVLSYAFEGVTFRLGSRCRYEPDFVVVCADGTVEVWEVKGSAGWKLDSESRTKWKAAAESWVGGLFVFRAAVKRTKKAGGGWDTSEVYQRATPWHPGEAS